MEDKDFRKLAHALREEATIDSSRIKRMLKNRDKEEVDDDIEAALGLALKKFFSGMPDLLLAEVKHRIAQFERCPSIDDLRKWTGGN